METSATNGIERERQKEFAVDYTPRAVVRQGLMMARTLCPQLAAIRRFLDPCAGAGVFGSVVRELWPASGVLSIAIEPRGEEEPHLRRHHDAIYLDTFQACAELPRGSEIDLIATNPKFGIWPELLPWALHRLSERGVLLLYGLSNWGHSREPSERSDIFAKYPPLYQLRVGGRVRHRVGKNDKGKPYGTDSRKYSWWLLDMSRPGTPGRHTTIDLAQLLPHELRFTAVPGTELDDEPEIEVAS